MRGPGDEGGARHSPTIMSLLHEIPAEQGNFLQKDLLAVEMPSSHP